MFENLHWHRYSMAYRHAFVKNVQSLARQFPDVTFLVKPHHAGMWLTQRHRGLRPDAANVVIADPAVAAWEPYTASALLGHLSAVITSPSTVALDAARHGMPTAVVAIDLGLENYNPLTLIRQTADWFAFVQAALDPARRDQLLAQSAAFVRHTLASEDGAGFVVNDLASVIHAAYEKESRVH
ncbi:MAG: hypothetical protein EON57_10245 [Alphaproteobacteria bacterium]|nr:MAG: hypothetical protein EON57_10245 [Alphaproteobacteria bacterium]